jgi:hypothetical protein
MDIPFALRTIHRMVAGKHHTVEPCPRTGGRSDRTGERSDHTVELSAGLGEPSAGLVEASDRMLKPPLDIKQEKTEISVLSV